MSKVEKTKRSNIFKSVKKIKYSLILDSFQTNNTHKKIK